MRLNLILSAFLISLSAAIRKTLYLTIAKDDYGDFYSSYSNCTAIRISPQFQENGELQFNLFCDNKPAAYALAPRSPKPIICDGFVLSITKKEAARGIIERVTDNEYDLEMECQCNENVAKTVNTEAEQRFPRKQQKLPGSSLPTTTTTTASVENEKRFPRKQQKLPGSSLPTTTRTTIVNADTEKRFLRKQQKLPGSSYPTAATTTVSVETEKRIPGKQQKLPRSSLPTTTRTTITSADTEKRFPRKQQKLPGSSHPTATKAATVSAETGPGSLKNKRKIHRSAKSTTTETSTANAEIEQGLSRNLQELPRRTRLTTTGTAVKDQIFHAKIGIEISSKAQEKPITVSAASETAASTRRTAERNMPMLNTTATTTDFGKLASSNTNMKRLSARAAWVFWVIIASLLLLILIILATIALEMKRRRQNARRRFAHERVRLPISSPHGRSLPPVPSIWPPLAPQYWEPYRQPMPNGLAPNETGAHRNSQAKTATVSMQSSRRNHTPPNCKLPPVRQDKPRPTNSSRRHSASSKPSARSGSHHQALHNNDQPVSQNNYTASLQPPNHLSKAEPNDGASIHANKSTSDEVSGQRDSKSKSVKVSIPIHQDYTLPSRKSRKEQQEISTISSNIIKSLSVSSSSSGEAASTRQASSKSQVSVRQKSQKKVGHR